MSPSPSVHKHAEGWGVSVRKRAYPWKASVRKRTRTLLGDLKIALRGGADMDARRRRGGGVGEKGFRVGPFVLCKNGCWRQRRRNTNHLEERLLDQAQARASYTPLFWGRSRSIPQCMVSNV